MNIHEGHSLHVLLHAFGNLASIHLQYIFPMGEESAIDNP